ncbi:MAG: DoxX family protein [Moraxellaceae bacterium]
MLLFSQILLGLLGVFFLVTGWLKASGNAHMVKEFQKFQYPQWLRVLAGLIELAAAPMMLTAFWWPGLAALGAFMVCPVMLGAAYTNFIKRPAAFGWGTLVIFLLCATPVVLQFSWLLTLPLRFIESGFPAFIG